MKIYGTLAGKKVRRLGFGAMRLTGAGIWGPPQNEREAITLLREVLISGIQHIDTADAYGPQTSEELICKALYPYPDDLLIATKGGFVRHGPGIWTPCGRPAYLRQCVENSLKRLKLDTIDLYYLHRIDPEVPFADQIGVLDILRNEGKIKAIGLSKVNQSQIIEAMKISPIAAVQNNFSYFHQEESKSVLTYCELAGIPFVPYAPLNAGKCFHPTDPNVVLNEPLPVAAISWILNHSPATFPIPGTSNIFHFRENLLAETFNKITATNGQTIKEDIRT